MIRIFYTVFYCLICCVSIGFAQDKQAEINNQIKVTNRLYTLGGFFKLDKNNKIEEAYLGHQQINDLSFLIGHPVKILHIQGNLINNIEDIKGLPLVELQCSLNKINNIAPLGGIKTLERLDISFTQVENIEPLKGLKLQRLAFNNTAVKDISALKGMPVKNLIFYSTPVVDISVLSGMPLEVLNASGTHIEDISPLKNVTSLSELYLGGSRISSIDVLRGLRIKRLDISNTNVTDIAPLKAMQLSHLNLANCQIKDINHLRGIRFTSLNINEIPNVDLTIFRGAPLTELRINGCLAGDLTPLRGMPITTLHAERNRLTNIAALKGMPLKQLNLSSNRIVDLAPLKGASLTTLNLSVNRIKSIAPLTGMTTLTELYIGRNPVEDLSPLKNINLLKFYFNFDQYGEIKGIQTLRDMKSLQFVAAPAPPEYEVFDFWKMYDENGFKRPNLGPWIDPKGYAELELPVIDLIKLIEPNFDAFAAQGWKMDESGLYRMNESYNVLSFPYSPPEEYDYRVDFTWYGTPEQPKNNPEIAITAIKKLPDGTNANFALSMNKWHTVLESIKGVRMNVTMQAFPPKVGNRYALILKVRKNGIRGYIDHYIPSLYPELICDWQTDFSDMSFAADWAGRVPTDRLSILMLHPSARVHSAKVIEVTGNGNIVSKQE